MREVYRAPALWHNRAFSATQVGHGPFAYRLGNFNHAGSAFTFDHDLAVEKISKGQGQQTGNYPQPPQGR